MAGYYAALTGVLLLVKAPLTWYSGYYLSHAYGLSSQPPGAWLTDLFKGVGVDVLTTIPILWGLYWLIQRSPRRWALWFWAALIPVIAFGIFAAPIVVDPLFNKFTPLPPGRLHDRIEALAAKAGIPDAPILVADKSKQTQETNAYVTGIGSSARIVIWDTTLQRMPEDQIVAIVGHEMGHYVLKHIYWGFALSVGGLLVLLPLAKLVYEALLRRFGPRWGINGPGDYAAVPALLLIVSLFSFFLAPITNAVSREIEHQADAYGLSVTQNRPAMARAFVSLSEQNLSDPNPPAFIKFWLFTHPPLSERIDFALGRKSGQKRRIKAYTMSHPLFLEKLTLHNFRSFHEETVTFANPLFLVGQNGSGKSNFVDALAFISECMTSPLQSVIERRGGLVRVAYLRTPITSHVHFHLDFRLGDELGQRGNYAFGLQIVSKGTFVVGFEEFRLGDTGKGEVWFSRRNNTFRSNISGIQPVLSSQALAMPLIGGVQDLSSAYQALAAMRVYRINPAQISGVQNQDSDTLLTLDGSNINSILHRLSGERGQLRRVNQLLQTVVPGVETIPSEFSNGKALLYFDQQWPGIKTTLQASAMSTGTLSTLGLIVAALQDPAPSVIAIEEPEMNIHPGALEAIADIIHIAAERTQVVVTTHSPDLLDTKWIQPENLRVVEWKDGATRVSELGAAPIKALRQHLMGAGELMRANALDAAAPVLEEALA